MVSSYQSIMMESSRRAAEESPGLELLVVEDSSSSSPEKNGETENVMASNKLLSPLEASIHLVKGNLGPGCLNLPHAFALTGCGLGSGLFFVVAFQGIYSMWLLLQCKNALVLRENGNSVLLRENSKSTVQTFMDVAHAALGPWGGRTVEVFLFVLQSGVCCVFLSLLSTNLRAALPALSSSLAVFIVTLALSVTVLLRFLKDLVWLSLLANVIMVLAILTACVAGIVQLFRDESNNGDALSAVPNSGGPRTFSAATTFTSDMFFAFEGIGLVLPIENSFAGPAQQQKDHSQSLSFGTILIRSMSLTALLFLVVGVPTSLGFPDIKTGSVTAYLAQRFPHQLWFSVINDLVMVAVALTFPLQLQPALQVIDRWLDRDGHYDDIGVCRVSSRTSDWISVASEGSAEQTTLAVAAEPDGLERIPLELSASLPRIAQRYRCPPMHCGFCRPRSTWLVRRWMFVLACALIVVVVNDLGLLMALFGAIGQT
jgi:amino acid permease